MFKPEVLLAIMEAPGLKMESTEEAATVENVANISGSSIGSEIENLDNIKKFIEAQEKDIQNINDNDKKTVHTDKNVQKVDKNSIQAEEILGTLVDDLEKDPESLEIPVENIKTPAQNPEKLLMTTEDVIKPAQNDDDETMAEASSVMEMILSKTEAHALETENVKHGPKPTINSVSGNTSMPLLVGSKVEAKDFSEDWYPAQIAEVDYDEMEVLVHYEIYLRKPDEWISVSSPRLRPFTGITLPKPEEKLSEVAEVKIEPKEKESSGNDFVVGERCLARWRDNRRFVATIDKDLGDGKFEVIFDDGFRWPCTTSRLSKLKEQRDTSLPPAVGPPSPVTILQGGPSTAPVPTYHTHLFDPTRDYLGSKSERREKKRKLNIKEIFNIGQKKYKMPKIEKAPKEKVKKVVKPKVKEEVKIEQGMPDAVASIIGTVLTSQIKPWIKDEPTDIDLCNTDRPNDSIDSKSDLDPIDEEDKLEKFDKPDQFVHNQVIDKMKEAISKLEGGLKDEIEKLHSPVRYGSPPTLINLKREIVSPKPGGLSTSESPKLLAELLKQEIASPKTEILSPKLQLPILTPRMGTEFTDSYNESVEPDSETPKTNVEEQITEITKPAIQTEQTNVCDMEMYAFETHENQMAVAEESAVDIEVSIVDVPSPSLIEEADFNIVPDDDSTKSDIEMGTVSPRLDIDSQPILVDIDAPLDIDDPQSNRDSTLVGIKKKKMKLKDFVKPKKKIKKEQKKKLLHNKWEEVARVKNELAEMKIKMKEMLQKIEREKQVNEGVPLPESCLLPDEWACHWVNGQPVGKVSEMQVDSKPDANGKPALPRRSVEVLDKRLPAGWTKHMVRRSVGHSAGKWDVVLVSPANRRFHTKLDMRHFLEIADEHTKSFEHALMDFGIHLKLARKLGWIRTTPDGVAEAPETILPANSQCCLSPLVKRKALALKKSAGLKKDKKKRPIKLKLQRRMHIYNSQLVDIAGEGSSSAAVAPEPELPLLEDGYVWVGSLKVQVLENLLRCPAEGCFKNFRNKALLMMHIKHYHRDMRKMLGATPRVLDLAAARTKPTHIEARHDSKIIKVKINKPPKREELYQAPQVDTHTPSKEQPRVPRSQDSPKLRLALNKPVKRPRVLLPMRRMEDQPNPELPEEDIEVSEFADAPGTDILDFETAISTHTVTKPLDKKKKFATFSKQISEDEEWFAINSDDVDTRSSFPRSATPDDSKMIDPKTGLMMSSDPMDEPMDSALYTFTENGQRIKIVHMKREEIINCHCGFREEDGLMVQCELCLCWQHALCHNIQKESEVPEKYTCSICLNPRRGRRSMRFLHDQDRMYEGLLPGAKQDESLRRSHELAGNLLRIEDALHALRVKYYVATKKDHPKLYLWAEDWEQTEITHKLNSEYSDLTVMINGLTDKEQSQVDTPSASADDQMDSDRCSGGDSQLGSQALLSGLLSSPSAASLELPISTSELERLARTVQEAAEAAEQWPGAPEPRAESGAPQPEAAIENDACRERLLKHVQRCQAALDSRLDSIEAQVAELESQDPSFGEHYETADHYPRIKQTVQMLTRDLDTMEELGVIT